MPSNLLSKEEYDAKFIVDDKKRKAALKVALDVRKFEIDLYWKRATYFWTFITAALAGYGAIQASSIDNKSDLSVFLCCLGIVFSVGWLCVNRGSKYWQENWENHVGLLEDEECGPIFKVTLTRPTPKHWKEWIKHSINGPSSISVSKVNQIISIYVVILWCLLLSYSLLDFLSKENILKNYIQEESLRAYIIIFLLFITFLTCFSFFIKLGRTHIGDHEHIATIRKTEIKNNS